MLVDPITHGAGRAPGNRQPSTDHRPHLTVNELLQLGLFQVAYLTEVADEDGAINIVLHGADGMAVAAVETLELAGELAEQLGLLLVAVH